MKIDNVRRIIQEEFKSEDRETIGKLAYILNSFMEQTVQAVNGNLNIEENFTQEIKVVKMKVNSSGTPQINPQIKTNLTTRIKGIVVISASNLTTPSNYLSNAPFISFGISEQVIKLNNITGLIANDEYNLTLLIFG